MKPINCLLLLFLGNFILSCNDTSGNKTSDFSIAFLDSDSEFQLGESLQASVKSASGAQIDSVVYQLGNRKLSSSAGRLEHVLQDEKLGKWDLSALVYSDSEEEKISTSVTIYNNTPPKAYSYKIIATYPHSPDAYTQGLEFYRDTLYESTGQYGSSSLRKVDLESGEVLKTVNLDQAYFAEGMSILNNKIYQLTWREGLGFVYDAASMEKRGEFTYNESKEGWGLTNDGEKLYKSDGTEKIWVLNPQTLEEESYIQTVTHRTISTQLNELEWVEGRIYANTYQRDGVAIINPQNGAIEGVINFKGLREKLGNVNELDPLNDVLNGIAYDRNTGKLYVTGKKWDKLFEVEIIER